jgi:hypothetical protein
MSGFVWKLPLVAAGFLTAVGIALVPHGWEAARLIDGQDDPVKLTEVGLDRALTPPVARREIEAALAAGDAELAQSFVELARERGIAIDPALAGRVDAAMEEAQSHKQVAKSFAYGLVTGQAEDISSFAGTALGDLFVFGDIRDAAREGFNGARGQHVDKLVLGLSLAGIAVTAGTYATLAAGAPARVGLSVVKVAGKSGRIGERLMRAIRLEKTEGLVRMAGDIGRLQSKAGTRAALEGIKLAEQPKDLSKLARLAAVKGGKTRAVMKLLGRGAIALTTGLFNLALWVFWAVVNLIGFVVALKRGTERMAERYFAYRRRRRLRLQMQAAAA